MLLYLALVSWTQDAVPYRALTTQWRASLKLEILGLAGVGGLAFVCRQIAWQRDPIKQRCLILLVKLAPAAKKTLLRDTTGPEAGSDVCLLFP